MSAQLDGPSTADAGRNNSESRDLDPKQSGEDDQILLVLVGLPGSGKTTFAEALVTASEPGHNGEAGGPSSRPWIRASQDDAPSRRRQECEARVRNGLRQGCNVVVDRVGFDATQRSHFVSIADGHRPRPKVYALYMHVDPPTLEARLGLRTNHPTLADPIIAMRVLADMQRQLVVPTASGGEGFDRIYTLPEDRQPSNGDWHEGDISAVLRSIEEEGIVETAPRIHVNPRPPPHWAGAGRSRGYNRPPHHGGRGDYRGLPRGSAPPLYSHRGARVGPPEFTRPPMPYPQPQAAHHQQRYQPREVSMPNPMQAPPLDAPPFAPLVPSATHADAPGR